MQSNLTLLKTVGWQALALDLPTNESDQLAGTDIVHDQEAGDVWTTLFDHASCAIAIADGTGRFTRINPKFCVLTGYTPNEIINRPFNELIDEFGGSQATSLGRQKPTNRDHTLRHFATGWFEGLVPTENGAVRPESSSALLDHLLLRRTEQFARFARFDSSIAAILTSASRPVPDYLASERPAYLAHGRCLPTQVR